MMTALPRITYRVHMLVQTVLYGESVAEVIIVELQGMSPSVVLVSGALTLFTSSPSDYF